MAEQINIFVENKPGRLKKVTEVLFQAGINLRAVEIQDRGDFGIVKLLVSDPHKAHLALSEAGLAAALQKILAIVIDDKPGGLYRLMKAFDEKGINVQNAYGFVVESAKEAVCCVEAADMDKTARVVEAAGFRILSDSELYDL